MALKVAVPVRELDGLDSEISPHFGRAAGFVIADLEDNEIEELENTSEHMGGQGKPPELLDEAGIDLLLCANLGRRAVQFFDRLDIDVCSGASGTAGDALQAWRNDELEPATEAAACKGHDHK